MARKILKKAIIIFTVAFLCVYAFSLEPFHIDINTEFGLTKGEINEYVFYSPIPNTEYVLSRLDWDVDFIKFFGASIDFVLFEHIYFGLSGRFGLPSSSGNMQDYDWMNVNIRGYDKEWYDSHYWLTHYSKHDNQLTTYLDGIIKLGGIVNLPWNIFLMPSVALQGQEFNFEGLYGYLKHAKYNKQTGCYNEWSEDILSVPPAHWKPISYIQQRMILFLELSAYTTIVPRFKFEVEGKFSPFAMVTAVDTHYASVTSGTNYLDKPKGFCTWGVFGKIQFSFDKLCRLALTGDYQFMPVLKGFNYSKNMSSNYYPSSPSTNVLGGASSKLFSFSLMATLFF